MTECSHVKELRDFLAMTGLELPGEVEIKCPHCRRTFLVTMTPDEDEEE